jgi:hypothetical protein
MVREDFMNKISAVVILFAGLILVGCSTQTGPAGPQGSQGSSGPSALSFSYQDGVFPTSSYAGTTNTWLDASNPTTSNNGSTTLHVAMGPATTNYGRELIKFNVSNIPVNAQILNAALILKTQTTTNLASGVTYSIGVYDMGVSAMISGGCTWINSASWNLYNGAAAWSQCNGIGAGFIRGSHYVAFPMDTVYFTSTANGTSKLYGWNLTPSVVQFWITGYNNGLMVGSNSDTDETAGFIDFYPNTDATAANHPELVVSYKIP